MVRLGSSVTGPSCPKISYHTIGGRWVVVRSPAVNGSPRHNPTVRAMLVAIALGAVVAGSASLASHLTSTPRPVALSTGPTQIANAEELPAPGLLVNSTSTTSSTGAPTTTATPTTTGTTTTTTTAPATTSTTPAPPVTTTNRPVPPGPTTTQRPSTSPGQAAQLFQLVNAARDDWGCDPLREDSRLDNAAIAHSEDMSNNDYFSHSGPGSTRFDQRIESYGYDSPGGENIAEGQTSAQQVFHDWMSDRGHRDNILNCQFVAMGVGVDTQGWYWTQDFGY